MSRFIESRSFWKGANSDFDLLGQDPGELCSVSVRNRSVFSRRMPRFYFYQTNSFTHFRLKAFFSLLKVHNRDSD